MGKVNYHHTFTLLDPILNYMNPAQTLTRFFLTLYCYLYPYMHGSLKASSFLQFFWHFLSSPLHAASWTHVILFDVQAIIFGGWSEWLAVTSWLLTIDRFFFFFSPLGYKDNCLNVNGNYVEFLICIICYQFAICSWYEVFVRLFCETPFYLRKSDLYTLQQSFSLFST